MNLQHCRADFGQRCDSAYAAHFQEQLVVTPTLLTSELPRVVGKICPRYVVHLRQRRINGYSESTPQNVTICCETDPRLKSTRFFVANPGFDK